MSRTEQADRNASSVVASLILGLILASSSQAQNLAHYPGGQIITAGTVSEPAVADVNDDGLPDIVVGTFQSGIAVWLGQSDGGFVASAVQSPGWRTVQVGDITGDGCSDLVGVVESSPLELAIETLPGLGGGKFAPPVRTVLGECTFELLDVALALGDLNGDGQMDVGVTNYGSGCGGLIVAFGQEDGTFIGANGLSMGKSPRDLVFDDFNTDGKLDIATAVSPFVGTERISVSLGNGDGTFSSPIKSTVPKGQPDDIATADLDEDGTTDMVVSLGAISPWVPSGVGILRGIGNGTFVMVDTVVLVVNQGQWFSFGDVALADMDGDGLLDVVTSVAFEPIPLKGIWVLRNLGGMSFSEPVFMDFSHMSKGPATQVPADFDRDGQMDLVVTYSPGPVVYKDLGVLYGIGDGTVSVPYVAPVGVQPIEVAVGDFDNDGSYDAIVTHEDAGIGLTLSLGTGEGMLGAAGPVGAMALTDGAVPVR